MWRRKGRLLSSASGALTDRSARGPVGVSRQSGVAIAGPEAGRVALYRSRFEASLRSGGPGYGCRTMTAGDSSLGPARRAGSTLRSTISRVVGESRTPRVPARSAAASRRGASAVIRCRRVMADLPGGWPAWPPPWQRSAPRLRPPRPRRPRWPWLRPGATPLHPASCP